MSTTVGVISDTHGLLRPEAAAALAGCSVVLHAGDIGDPDILESLRKIAPVYAVRGNVDHGTWAAALPKTSVIEIAGRKLYMLHSIQELDVDPAAAGYHAVIFGHSHVPSQELRDGVLFLNPGSAGPRRFHLPISVALLRIDSHGLEAEPIII